ncbi:universal stress protein [Streptomyces sp. NBC_00201]|uniref:universal stress protein n=1 Tax=unclassified Streptomyces TaxID=2593676 RepID=UPI002256C18A|nr:MULTISPECIES: universal stress protein [unclassified Streptomyces]MCX5250446.1 universal stress protein [Streptomyces sp. NBC_00201]MCX5291626.1 universal stress protein [Streptomyces sp. NBC_00183]
MERMIIAGVDRSARSRAAADWATREALLRRLPLRVLHVVPPDAPDPVHRWPYRGEAVAEHVVAELVDRHPALTVRGKILAGTPGPVLRTAGDGAQLLVVGLRGEGGHAGVTVGSTAAVLATASAGPVVLVPGTLADNGPPRPSAGVTVGVDVRTPAGSALDFAFEAARLRGARLHAVYAWKLPAHAAASPLPVLEEDRNDGPEAEASYGYPHVEQSGAAGDHGLPAARVGKDHPSPAVRMQLEPVVVALLGEEPGLAVVRRGREGGDAGQVEYGAAGLLVGDRHDGSRLSRTVHSHPPRTPVHGTWAVRPRPRPEHWSSRRRPARWRAWRCASFQLTAGAASRRRPHGVPARRAGCASRPAGT